jgi:hypothetical protein
MTHATIARLGSLSHRYGCDGTLNRREAALDQDPPGGSRIGRAQSTASKSNPIPAAANAAEARRES